MHLHDRTRSLAARFDALAGTSCPVGLTAAGEAAGSGTNHVADTTSSGEDTHAR